MILEQSRKDLPEICLRGNTNQCKFLVVTSLKKNLVKKEFSKSIIGGTQDHLPFIKSAGRQRQKFHLLVLVIFC